jgi:2-keto-3-deoxy-L-rhamnonate aldolase RhmA
VHRVGPMNTPSGDAVVRRDPSPAGTESIGTWLFTTDATLAVEARQAGVDAIVVDWEWREKRMRQAGASTEINRDTPADLERMGSIGGIRVVCRLNAMGAWTPREIETAITAGATDLLLPMVCDAEEVYRYRELVSGRVRAGILVETVEACSAVEAIVEARPDMVYVGLNDLAISRGDASIFEAVADGTVERLCACFGAVPHGFGGLTVLDGGSPIPCRDLLAEMARTRCAFSFLRRSFKRDIPGRDMKKELARLREEWGRLGRRSPDEVDEDQQRLVQRIRAAAVAPEQA